MPVSRTVFGTLADGTKAYLYSLTNSKGMRVDITDFGGAIVNALTPDREGRLADITLGCSSLDSYVAKNPYLGALIGRFGNRIAGGRFTLDGAEYRVALNFGVNHLHGGHVGFDKKCWETPAYGEHGRALLRLRLLSPDGDEGYPGTLDTTVAYELSESNELVIDYTATTDKPTVVNLTNHAYWNLAGETSGTILGHEVTLFADYYTPGDTALVPTGTLAPVEGTPMDFRSAHRIGERIKTPFEQTKNAGGYDHNYVVRGQPGTLRPAAFVREPLSGRTMEVLTTEPGVQFYSGNFLDGTCVGKSGVAYVRNAGLCLETQHFPDSPNNARVPVDRPSPR